jgi:hypothetical protein
MHKLLKTKFRPASTMFPEQKVLSVSVKENAFIEMGLVNPEGEKMERDRRERPKGIETAGQRFGRLIRQATDATVTLHDTRTNPLSDVHVKAQDALAAVNDEFRQRCLHGNGYDAMLTALFEDRVAARVQVIFEDRRDEKRAKDLGEVLAERRAAIKEDWPIIRAEFPGQFPEPDYELQAQMGEPPVVDIVNFGRREVIK